MSIPLFASPITLTGTGMTVLVPNTTNGVFAISGIDITLAQVIPTAAGSVVFAGALQSLIGGLTTNINQLRYSNNGAAGTILISEKLASLSVGDFIMLPRGGNIQVNVSGFLNITTGAILVLNLYGLLLP
jgi:hypothetical protein